MRAFIIHGYGAGPADHWFPWLGERLSQAGIPTTIPALPDPERPDFDRWPAAPTARPCSLATASAPSLCCTISAPSGRPPSAA